MQLDISLRCDGIADCFGQVHLQALVVVGAGHSCKVYAIFHYQYVPHKAVAEVSKIGIL